MMNVHLEHINAIQRQLVKIQLVASGAHAIKVTKEMASNVQVLLTAFNSSIII